MKYYKDEEGNLYSVDRETGEKTLVRPAVPDGGNVVAPAESDDINVEDD